MTNKQNSRYRYLEREDLREWLKEANTEELAELCTEIRRFLLENVSRTGGHLASNLGAVELTVALHRCFDSATDRLIFDVGHQCYTHKILSGRKDQFSQLRQLGGISGFLKPSESKHDACITGHASNSVSVGLGMAHARTLRKQQYHVVSIIGDGALTGGMAYEALNSVGASKEPLILVLNDNNMSIDKNVGAMNLHLNRLRTRPQYLRMKQNIHEAFSRIPGGDSAADFISRSKNAAKRMILPTSLFEQMGIMYLGPVDGHDISAMTELFQIAKELHRPVLIHVMTQKGKGYTYSERHPDVYHGVSKFDVDEGVSLNPSGESFSAVFGREMIRLGARNPKLCAITAAMPSGTGLSGFAKKYPKRFFDVGIAEEHAVTMTAGMAKQGLRPVCALYSTFLQRAYDQLIHDVALDHLPCIFAIDRAGIVGADGPTHNGVFDVGFLRQIPGIQILAPSNYAELRTMLSHAVAQVSGPIAIRYPRGKEGAFTADQSQNTGVFLTEGSDVVLIGYGVLINALLEAQEQLERQGIHAAVYKINDLSAPFSAELLQAIADCSRVLVAEDVVENGSIGQALAAQLVKGGLSVKWLAMLNCGDSFAPQGTVSQVYAAYQLNATGITDRCLEEIKREKTS
ncbi:MAG: 1-deoxy-D-xylulose-5-phosphate synthase [Eubacteriales bacterium]|nr:1-deoxy-D-xylulose-5-phosphate synthase [Eubacteriales bacterium]